MEKREERGINKTLQHKNICDEIHQTYKRKNADYGSSTSSTFEEYGMVAYMVRLSDKLNRAKTLVKNSGEYQVKDESLKDTLIDLAGYAILAVQDLENSKIEKDPKYKRGETFRNSITGDKFCIMCHSVSTTDGTILYEIKNVSKLELNINRTVTEKELEKDYYKIDKREDHESAICEGFSKEPKYKPGDIFFDPVSKMVLEIKGIRDNKIHRVYDGISYGDLDEDTLDRMELRNDYYHSIKTGDVIEITRGNDFCGKVAGVNRVFRSSAGITRMSLEDLSDGRTIGNCSLINVKKVARGSESLSQATESTCNSSSDSFPIEEKKVLRNDSEPIIDDEEVTESAPLKKKPKKQRNIKRFRTGQRVIANDGQAPPKHGVVVDLDDPEEIYIWILFDGELNASKIIKKYVVHE